MIKLITDETNRYSKQEIKPEHPKPFWYDVTPSEIRIFLSLIFLMGIDLRPNYELYWSALIHSPIYADTMSLRRFKEIKRYLHFTDNDNYEYFYKSDPEIQKVSTVIKTLRSKFIKDVSLGRDIFID